MKKRHSAEQIVRILREVESAPKIGDAIKKLNISEQTYYTWKKKFGGMSVDDAKRLKELEQENRQLKRLLAETIMMNDGLREVNSKKW